MKRGGAPVSENSCTSLMSMHCKRLERNGDPLPDEQAPTCLERIWDPHEFNSAPFLLSFFCWECGLPGKMVWLFLAQFDPTCNWLLCLHEATAQQER